MPNFLNKFFSIHKNKDYGILTDDKDKFDEVNSLIEDKIKHFIKSHNGKIKLIAVRENVVYIEMSGSCHSCPAIEITLHGFIKKILSENLLWFDRVVKLN